MTGTDFTYTSSRVPYKLFETVLYTWSLYIEPNISIRWGALL